MADTAFFCTLSHEGVMSVRGADANKFLQGQITCNLNYLSPTVSSLGARCNPKGRMLSSFRVLAVDDGYLLAMASELLEKQLADLKKYAVFSKSKLLDESAEWTRFGLYKGDGALLALGFELNPTPGSVSSAHNLIAVHLGNERVELWVPASEADEIKLRLSAQLPEAPVNDWLLGQIRAGIGQVFGPAFELFIPQMINLQAVGGVSFKKGCYTGQEIVARMQYLGKLKRRMYRLSVAASELPEPATTLFSPERTSAVGEVVMAARSETAIELLAVVQEDAISDGRILLGAPDGEALTLLDLPYTLNSDLEIQR